MPPKEAKPAVPSSAKESAVSPNWEQDVYTPERIERWLKGEITLQELSVVTGPEMLEMAVIGFSMYEQGKYPEAEVIFRGLASLNSKESYYRTALGAVFLAQDDLPSAEACFDEAIGMNTKDMASFVNRGEVYLRQGKILEAAQDFKSAVDLDPENKDPMSQRARALAAAALESIDAAAVDDGGEKSQKSSTKPTEPMVGSGKPSSAPKKK